MSALHHLISSKQKSSKRVGRGYGSGKGGHTSTRGTKGHTSRSGGKTPLWFEGGQLPLIKRVPMLRGKGRLKPVAQVTAISVGQLQSLTADVITVDTLKLARIVPRNTQQVKLIAGGSLSQAVEVRGMAVTKGARTSIERAGGRVVE